MRTHHASLLAALSLAQAGPAWAYGEPDPDGRPSLQERLLLALSNQVRQAPHEWPGWDTSLATPEARPAMAGDDGLFEAARFHADDMAATGTFAHESSDGTSFETRVGRYFSGSAGENILMGSDDPRAALSAWMRSEGHRRNLLDATWTHLGTGRTLAGPSAYWVQDFGQISRSVPPPVPAASFESGARSKVVANWFDLQGSSPRSIRAALGAKCVELTVIAGPPGNQTFAADVERPDPCDPLVFFAESLDSTLTRYPSTGGLRVSCDQDFDPTITTSPCDPKRVVIDSEESGCSATRSTSLLVLLLLPLLRRVDRGRQDR